MADWTSPWGETLYNVHEPEKCAGRHCTIHNPSDHHMRDWPMVWRDWHGYFERQCPHGIGHPDPDGVAYMESITAPKYRRYVGVHGCDMCCHSRAKVRTNEPEE